MRHLVATALLMALTVLAGGPARGASRKVVVAEKFTATWCQYCPGAARGFEQLKAEYDSTVVMIAYHQSDDPFTIPEFTNRRTYYTVGGYPAAIFDGVLRKSGGSYDGTMYPDYLPLYTQRAGVAAPLEIHLDMETMNAARITISNHSPETVSGTLQVVLVERFIPYAWQNMTALDFVARDMLPGAAGESVTLDPGQTLITSRSFVLNPTWTRRNCRLVAFVQTASREILQGAELALPETLPTLRVLWPDGGEIFTVGDAVEIRWSWTQAVGDVRIDYSRDGGSSWQPVAASVPNTGTYLWQVPEGPGPGGRIRIQETDGLPVDASDGSFTVLNFADLTGDGRQDAADLTVLAHILAGNLPEPPAADLDGDSDWDSLDLLWLRCLVAY